MSAKPTLKRRSWRQQPVLALAALLLAASLTQARAELPPQLPRHSLHYLSLTAAQWNPLGAQTELSLGYRYRLYDSRSVLFRNSYVNPFFIVRLNPAFGRVGVGLELQPLAILRLRARYEYRAYFGTFDMIQSFTSPRAEHDPDRRDQRGDANLNYRATGQEITLKATLRLKVGPIALLNDTTFLIFALNLRGSDTVFYDAFVDTLLPGRGWAVVNDMNLVYVTRFRLIAGLRYSVMHAAYSAADYGGAGPFENINTPLHRLGAIVAYTFTSRNPRYQKPTVVLIVNWWLKNRYRTGQEISQALPYGVIAFRVQGDLLRP